MNTRKSVLWMVYCTLFHLLPLSVHAQGADLGNWLAYFGSKKVNERWNWHHEIQYRDYNSAGDMEQLLLRTGFGYNLTAANNNLLMGYAYILSENYIDHTEQKISTTEHRIFQQYIYNHHIGPALVQHRLRYEERFFEEDFKMRARYFLAYRKGLNHKDIIDHTLYLSVYNEIFLNIDANTFDRNRLYGGLGYRFNKVLRVEVGYMNQFFKSANRDQLNFQAFVNF